MAASNTPSEPQPLTDEQIKQRDELNAQAAAYAAAQAEKARKAKEESLATASALATLLDAKNITDAFDTALNDEKLDFATKARIQSLRSTLQYHVGEIKSAVAATAPMVVPVAA